MKGRERKKREVQYKREVETFKTLKDRERVKKKKA
jgi:hypothetical protein